VPMFFGGIGEEATLRAVAGAGLRLERLEIVEGGGHLVRFLWLVARRPTQ